MLAVPNWGLELGALPALARLTGLPWRELYDIDPEHATGSIMRFGICPREARLSPARRPLKQA